MAFTKHIVSPTENFAFALRHNDIRDEASIGGLSRERETMERFLTYYFNVEADEPTAWPQRNKCRYDFSCDWRTYKIAIDKMREDGIQVGSVASHGRLMT